MAKPTILQREVEEVAQWARHAYPTAEARTLGASDRGAAGIACCRSCRHRRDVGYFTSGPLAGEDLWICEIEEGGW